MSCGSRPEVWIAALIAAALTRPGVAQTPARGWHETQLWAVAVTSRPAVASAGLGLAWRDAGRTRIGAALAAGVADGGDPAGRLELSWHFLLDPARRAGLAVYGGGGMALTAVRGDHVRPWLQLVLGAETSPAASHGWFFEAGFGGGVRVATGVRWRKRR
jgi:hypothetical protein